MDYRKLIERLKEIREAECIDAERSAAIEEAMDIVYDYEKAVCQSAELMLKYETSRDAINRGFGNWQCPTCQKFISFGNDHCHWCGRKLGWEVKPKKSKKKK